MPFGMKSFGLLCLSMLAVLFAACKSTTPLDQTTPKFYFPTDSVFTTCGDTLLISGSVQNGFATDSITAGDTAIVRLEVDGVFHALRRISVTPLDPDAGELVLPGGVYADSLFSAVLDSAGCHFEPLSESIRAPFSFMYHATQAAKEAGVTIEVLSEAPEPDNSAQLTLKMPARLAP